MFEINVKNCVFWPENVKYNSVCGDNLDKMIKDLR